MFKKILRGAGALALSGGLIAGGAAMAAPAQAVVTAATPVYVAKPLNVKGVYTDGDMYKGRVIAVRSKGCKVNRFSISGSFDNRAYVSDFRVAGDLYRNGKKYKTVTFRNNNSSYYYDFCPKKASERYGAFQLKNIRVSGVYWVKDTAGKLVSVKDSKGNYQILKKSFSYGTGKSSKTFYYKGAIDGSLYGKKAAGSSKRTFTAKLSYFSDKHQKWVKYNSSGAKLQVKSGGKWKSIKSLKFKKGKAVYSLRASSKKSYRLYVPAKSYALGGTTKGFKL